MKIYFKFGTKFISEVKPIIGNRDIEKINEATFVKNQLPFSMLSLDEVVQKVDSPEIENHLREIYSYLGNSINFILK